MKKIICILLTISMLLLLTGCQKTKVLHCDHCNNEIAVKEDSNMTEDWIIYCETCNEELFKDDPILGTN